MKAVVLCATGGAGLRTPSDGDGWRRAATDGGERRRRSVPEMYAQLLYGLIRREMAVLCWMAASGDVDL